MYRKLSIRINLSLFLFFLLHLPLFQNFNVQLLFPERDGKFNYKEEGYVSKISRFSFKPFAQFSELRKNIYNAWHLTLMLENCAGAIPSIQFYKLHSSILEVELSVVSSKK